MINYNKLSLRQLINLKELIKIQDNFSAVTNVYLRTLDEEGNHIVSPTKQPQICKLLQTGNLKDKVCGRNCLPTFLDGKATVDKNLSFHCAIPELKLSNFVIPLILHHKQLLGYIIAGPVILIKRNTKEEYQGVAEGLNLDADQLWNAILEIRVTSFQAMQSLIELLREIYEYMIKLAYQNITMKKEVVMRKVLPNLNRLLEALLDVAFEISKADVGSIMFLDKDEENLTIHTSRGIPHNIVANTRIKLGSSISGLAAKEGASFLIDDNSQDNRIRQYLNRPNISSSMVLPLKVRKRVLGVMNLGALRTSQVRFSSDSLNLMQKLVDLAIVTLR